MCCKNKVLFCSVLFSICCTYIVNSYMCEMALKAPAGSVALICCYYCCFAFWCMVMEPINMNQTDHTDQRDSNRVVTFLNPCNQDNVSDNVFGNLTRNISSCKYDINFKPDITDANTLILLHVNIRSLHKNFDQLHEFLSSLQFTPRVVCITETRIKKQNFLKHNFTFPQFCSHGLQNKRWWSWFLHT